jgi:hypothetical protein
LQAPQTKDILPESPEATGLSTNRSSYWWLWALINLGTVFVIALVISFLKPPHEKRIPPGTNGGCPKEAGCSDYAPFQNNAWGIPTDNAAFSVRNLNSDECHDCDLRMRKMCLTQIRSDQCETPRTDKMFVEFQNTWSNFGYLAAGLFVLYARPGVLGSMVGTNLCLMFLFSGWYHATLRPLVQAFDVAWIYGLLLSLIFYAISALGRLYADRSFRPGLVAALAIASPVFGVLTAILKYNDGLPGPLGDSDIMTGTLLGLLLLLVLEVLVFDGVLTRITFGWFSSSAQDIFGRQPLDTLQKLKYATYTMAPTIVGGFVRLTDGCGKPLCYPDSPFQAHALWHMLGALALFTTYNLFAQIRRSGEEVFTLS